MHLDNSQLLTSDEFGLDYTSRDTIDIITHAYLTHFLKNKNGVVFVNLVNVVHYW